MDNKLSQFDLWLKANEEFDYGVWKLTNNDERDHGVFETVKEYYPPGTWNTMREVCYHLWWHGNHEVVDRYSPQELYKIFAERTEEEQNVRKN